MFVVKNSEDVRPENDGSAGKVSKTEDCLYGVYLIISMANFKIEEPSSRDVSLKLRILDSLQDHVFKARLLKTSQI